MVQKQAALKGADSFFAEDDPLAELARIVGYEPPVENPTEPRVEPAFNLEDELLREFEGFDAVAAPDVSLDADRAALPDEAAGPAAVAEDPWSQQEPWPTEPVVESAEAIEAFEPVLEPEPELEPEVRSPEEYAS